MAMSKKPNGVTKGRWIAETQSNDRHELRVMNCAATTLWRGSVIAGMHPLRAAGVVDGSCLLGPAVPHLES